MSKFFSFVLVVAYAVMAGCVLTRQDGASFEKAIVIHESGETAGIQAEHGWLARVYPGYTLKQQLLQRSAGKWYDRMDIRTSDGQDKSVYFDITNFYGKLW